jgi:chitinase
MTGSTSAYKISFTAPTSYWVSFPSTTDYLLSPFAAVRILQKLTALPIYQYLLHFDLAATVEYVDYVNVMAYDLHGIWDRENPIGSQVLPHTNLTKIDLAMDLLWRNDVPASKVNLGLGFYGRAFELADPACAVPGCLFKGGAAKGPCTRNLGTLSYWEIMEIINKYNIKPTYDKESGVKWISWNTNQWVSYDDQDTIQQKIKYTNALGLGGLLIWAIDLDNSQLDALAGVLHPRRLGSLGDVAEDSANWQDINEGWCYFTECGVTHCKAGYILLETVQCGTLSLFADYGEAIICCPYALALDPHRWYMIKKTHPTKAV